MKGSFRSRFGFQGSRVSVLYLGQGQISLAHLCCGAIEVVLPEIVHKLFVRLQRMERYKVSLQVDEEKNTAWEAHMDQSQ